MLLFVFLELAVVVGETKDLDVPWDVSFLSDAIPSPVDVLMFL